MIHDPSLKEILLIPFFGWAISRLKPISINRKLKVESLKKVVEIAKAQYKDPEALRRSIDEIMGE